MALFGDYENAGAGIAKDAPQKKPFFRYWEIVGRKFWKLLEVNMLMMAVFLPLVAAWLAIVLLGEHYTSAALVIVGVMLVAFAAIFGAWIAGCTQILRKYFLEKPCFMMQTFFRAFKSSFKQACPLGLIDLLVIVSVACSFYIYPQIITQLKEAGYGGEWFYYVLFITTLSLGLAVLMMSFYGYPMIVSTELSFKNILKNSLALSFVALKKNLLTLFITAVIMGVFGLLTLYFPYVMTIVLLFMPVSFAAFTIVFNCYPIIQQYVINPYYAQRGEVSPELSFTNTGGENLFEDQGGKETPAPVEPRKKGKKGKIVS